MILAFRVLNLIFKNSSLTLIPFLNVCWIQLPLVTQCAVLYSIVLYCIVLYCIVLYCKWSTFLIWAFYNVKRLNWIFYIRRICFLTLYKFWEFDLELLYIEKNELKPTLSKITTSLILNAIIIGLVNYHLL